MASLTSTKQNTLERGAIAEVVSAIYNSLDNETKKVVDPWLPNIEEYSKQLIDSLQARDIQRRRRDVLIAASVYDAFLAYESRTQTAISLPLLSQALDLKICTVNTTWSKLFDTRVELSLEMLDTILLAKDQTINDGIHLAITKLGKAVKKKSNRVQEWLQAIENDALELFKELKSNIYSDYDPMVVAVVSIYAAIKNYHGKMAIKITQKNLADISGFSTSQLSKCWIHLFCT